MNNYKKLMLFALTALLGSFSAKADEGMWMIHAIDAALEKKMQERGLKLSAGEIYNADADGATIADAVVSMEFGCTGLQNLNFLLTIYKNLKEKGAQ